MATKDITVNISLNGEIDVEKIAEAVRKEIERVGFKVEVAPEPAKLKVGDYAKVVKSDNEAYLGLVVKLTKKWAHEERFNVTSIKKSGIASCAVEQMVRATEAEISESKRSQSEATELARWSKIGRTQSQYKVGDIVRYKDDKEIVEVVGITEFKFPEVQTHWSGICEEHFNNIELITPVEARFDRNASAD